MTQTRRLAAIVAVGGSHDRHTDCNGVNELQNSCACEDEDISPRAVACSTSPPTHTPVSSAFSPGWHRVGRRRSGHLTGAVPRLLTGRRNNLSGDHLRAADLVECGSAQGFGRWRISQTLTVK
jgi:hypothetical protein